MEKRTNSPYPRRDRPLLAVVGVILVVSAVLFTRNDREHEWRYYQYAFRQAVAEKFGPDKARTVPSGLQQTVGETGWQLSHGERSRLYIARALLQGADLVILDESFAALDPETLGRAVECVLRRARTVLVAPQCRFCLGRRTVKTLIAH